MARALYGFASVAALGALIGACGPDRGAEWPFDTPTSATAVKADKPPPPAPRPLVFPLRRPQPTASASGTATAPVPTATSTAPSTAPTALTSAETTELYRAQDACLSNCDQFACMRIAGAYRDGVGVPRDPLAGRRYALHACLECGAPGVATVDQCPAFGIDLNAKRR